MIQFDVNYEASYIGHGIYGRFSYDIATFECGVWGRGAGRGMSRSSDVGGVGKAALYGRIIVGH